MDLLPRTFALLQRSTEELDDFEGLFSSLLDKNKKQTEVINKIIFTCV